MKTYEKANINMHNLASTVEYLVLHSNKKYYFNVIKYIIIGMVL